MRIWFALLAAPILALADQSIAYATLDWACAHQNGFVVHVVHLPFLVATAAGTVMAWQLWRATLPVHSGNETVARRHFLAGLGVGSGALSVLVIVAMWVPAWVLPSCVR
jgi:hypothetical protein